MALKDKAVSLEGLKAVYDSQDTDGIKEDVAALQTDVSDLQSSFDTDVLVAQNGDIENSKLSFVDNAYIDNATGNILEYTGWKTSFFIPIGADTYRIKCIVGYTGSYNAFYDAEKSFISSFAFSTGSTITPPSNARFMRLSSSSNSFLASKFKIYSLSETAQTALKTLSLQKSSGTSITKNNTSYKIVLEATSTGNIGWCRTIAGDIYFKADANGTKIDNTHYEFTVPQFSSLVLPVVTGNPWQLQVKTQANVLDTDIVLFANTYATDLSGIVYERSLLTKINNFNPVESRIGNNDSVMRSICRFGESYGQPESVSALKACYDAGFNIIRVNLQFSSDGTPVLWHDQYINQHYQNVYDSNNTLVPYSENDRIKISETPIATLNQYKWGGTSYAVGIPLAESIIAAARKVGMELYFECKIVLDASQIISIIELIEKYGMIDRVSIVSNTHQNGVDIATQKPNIRIGFMNTVFSNQLKTDYLTLKTKTSNLFWFGWDEMALTSEIVEFLSENGIKYECGDFTDFTSIETYLESSYAWYCTGMEIQGSASPLIGQQIENSIV